MLWLEYCIVQAGTSWRVQGDWEGEVMGIDEDGTEKENYLYKPGDKFEVDKNGWLVRVDEE